MPFLKDFLAARSLVEHLVGHDRFLLTIEPVKLGVEVRCTWRHADQMYNCVEVINGFEIEKAIDDLPIKEALRRLITNVRALMIKLSTPK